jgi:hypothetical protein
LKRNKVISTIFLVHFNDLPRIPSPLDDIEIKFIPEKIETQL